MQFELGIIGAGNMAEAIARGVISSGLFTPSQLIASDLSVQRRQVFQSMQVQAVEDNTAVAEQSRAILLSVKPQQMKTALTSIAPSLNKDALIISIAAGISSRFIEDTLDANWKWRVIRTMPNTPMLVGTGMVGLSAGTHATPEDVARARKIFESAAKVVEVSEDKIDAVTAISGSGPAYFFYLVEQMIKAGVDLGLTEQQAHQLATTTALGAARMLATSSDSPQELRRKVTSPGGTTQAAITHMDNTQVGSNLVDAFKSAAKRSKELGV
jgi:pyrroline-5-carboxylate reductase